MVCMYLLLVDEFAQGGVLDEKCHCYSDGAHCHSAPDHGPPPAHTLEDAHIGNVAAEKLADIDGTAKNGPSQAAEQNSGRQTPCEALYVCVQSVWAVQHVHSMCESGEGCTRMCGLQTDGRNMQHMEIQASRDACGIEHAAPELLWWQHV